MVKSHDKMSRKSNLQAMSKMKAGQLKSPIFSQSLQTQAHIEVGDINDNDPVFDPVNYTVSVYENSSEGTPLVNVTATDADNGQNARITYTVTGGDPFSVFTADTQVSLYMMACVKGTKINLC